MTKELCLVEVQADLLEKLYKASKGSIRLITVGLSRIDETNGAILISYWKEAGFLTYDRNCTRYRVDSTYYSQLKFYTLKPRPRIPGTKKVKSIQNTPYFRMVCQRIWMSMRILQTFSIGQLQACSSACNDITGTFVNQLYQLNYIRLKVCYGSIYDVNEDIYQLIRDTGVKAPFYGLKLDRGS